MAELTMKVQKSLIDAKLKAEEEAIELRVRLQAASKRIRKLEEELRRLRARRKVRIVEDYPDGELVGIMAARWRDKLFGKRHR